MNYKKIIILIAIIILTASCSSNQKKQTAPSPSDSENRSVVAFGVIKAQESLEVSLGFPAKINKLFAKEGALIKENGLLAEIDDIEFKNSIQQMNGDLAALKEEAAYMKKSIDKKRNMLADSTDSDLLLLEKKQKNTAISYKKAQDELESKMELLEAGGITKEELSGYQEKVDNIRDTIDELKLSIESMKEDKHDELMRDEHQLNQKEYQISNLEQELGSLKSKAAISYLKNNNIISTFSNGVIGKINCCPGETIPAGKAIFSILNLDTLLVAANVDEQFIKDVHLGATAFVVSEIDRSQEFKGEVTFISSVAVQQNGETVFPLSIALDKIGDVLLPGCNVAINIMTDGE